MHCFCCDTEVKLARKVQIRRLVDWAPEKKEYADWSEVDMAAYTAYREQWTYRWGVVCHPCYRLLDNDVGAAEIGDQVFNIAGRSRRDKAAIIDEKKYKTWQAREAQKLGIDL